MDRGPTEPHTSDNAQEAIAATDESCSGFDHCTDGRESPDRLPPEDPAESADLGDDWMSSNMIEYFASFSDDDGAEPPVPTMEEFAAEVLERGADEAALLLRYLEPGPGSATLIAHLDPSSLSPRAMVSVIAATEKLASWVQARQHRWLALFACPNVAAPIGALKEYASQPGQRLHQGDRSASNGHASPDEAAELPCSGSTVHGDPDVETVLEEVAMKVAAAEVGAALQLSPIAANRRVCQAVEFAIELPATLRALEAGRIDRARSLTIADRTQNLPTELRRRVERAVLPKVATRTPGQVRGIVDRAVISVDPGAAKKRHERALRDRNVSCRPGDDGIGIFHAELGADKAQVAFGVIDQLAYQLKRNPNQVPDNRGVGALRADVFSDIFDQLATTGTVTIRSTLHRRATNDGNTTVRTRTSSEPSEQETDRTPEPADGPAPHSTNLPVHNPTSDRNAGTCDEQAAGFTGEPAEHRPPGGSAEHFANPTTDATTLAKDSKIHDFTDVPAGHPIADSLPDTLANRTPDASIEESGEPTPCGSAEYGDDRPIEFLPETAGHCHGSDLTEPVDHQFPPYREDQTDVEPGGSGIPRDEPPLSEPPRSEPPRNEPPRNEPPRSEPPVNACFERRNLDHVTADSETATPERVSLPIQPSMSQSDSVPICDGMIDSEIGADGQPSQYDCDWRPLGDSRASSGWGTHQGRLTHLNVTIAHSTLLGHDDRPGELDGYGIIPADLARAIATSAETITAIAIDPICGTGLDLGRISYRPRLAQRDHVTTRDQTCRFIGCRQPAKRCQLDHSDEFCPGRTDGGVTCPCNLICLCQFHHGLKTGGLWDTEQRSDGTVIWTSPIGSTYETQPRQWPTDDPDLLKSGSSRVETTSDGVGSMQASTNSSELDHDEPPF